MKKIFLSLALLTLAAIGMLSISSCKKEENNSFIELKGKINTALDPCHGSIIFDIESHDSIGQYGTYECCRNIFISLNNSIIIFKHQQQCFSLRVSTICTFPSANQIITIFFAAANA